MYLGSVKFFRHLILTIVALAIIIPTTAAIVLSVKYNSLKKENAELSEKIAVSENPEVSGEDKIISSAGNDGDKANEIISDGDEEEPVKIPDMTQDPYNKVSSQSPDPILEPSTEPVTVNDNLPSYAKLYPDLYSESYSDEVNPIYTEDAGWIYLTFDDGPSDKYTDTILSYLRDYSVPATFFVVPNENSGRRLNQIIAEGHSIGIHSFSHDYKKIYQSVEAYLEDFNAAYNLVYEQTGLKSDIFRFPGGSINDYNAGVRDAIIAEMTRRGFIYFDWSIDSDDAKGADWTHMYNAVLKGAEKIYDGEGGYTRSVVLMHDDNVNASVTIVTLNDILFALHNNSRDYQFGKLTKNTKPLQF